MQEEDKAQEAKGRIEIAGLHHTFMLGKVEVPVLHGIDLLVKPGSFTALCGTSGSGKSTLLNLIGGLTKPTKGRVLIDGVNVSAMTENELCLFRRANIGFIFQSYNLLPYLSARENVELALIFGETPVEERHSLAEDMLRRVGLEDRMEHKPAELSGGQQQRVSVARALVTRPKLILADEPTGNLDTTTGEDILGLLKELGDVQKSTFLIVTHDPLLAESCEHTVFLQDGVIVDKWRDRHAH